MDLKATLIARDRETESRWSRELEAACRVLDGLRLRVSTDPGVLGDVVFIDGDMREVDNAIDAIERKGRAVFLVVSENDLAPEALLENRIDDVLVYPFRPLEVQSKLRYYQQILMWDEVTRLNTSFSEVIQELHEDLKLAERLQKARLPHRFPEVKGMKVASRYAAGARSGGDHFDLAESRDGNTLSMVLSDSSSYGLSSAVLGALMRVANQVSSEQARSSVETVQKIRAEVLATLKEKDRLSLFYGVLSRKDYKLRFLNLGTSCAFYAPAGKPFVALPSHGPSITRAQGELAFQEKELALEAGSRLVLVSDGFSEVLQGADSVKEVLNQLRGKDPADTLNELTFRLKSGFQGEDDVPPQDCTGIVFDMDTRLIRLAS